VEGSATLNPDGSFSYTPAANYNGPDSFTYRASDGTSLSNVPTVSITVNDVNDAPTLTLPGAQTAFEDVDQAISGITVGDLDSSSLPGFAIACTSVS